MRVVRGFQRPSRADLVNEELTDLELAVVKIPRSGEHCISAATGLPVIIEGEGEAVRRGDWMALVLEPRDARPDGLGEVDRIIRTGDYIKIETRDRRIDADDAREVPEIARAVLEIVTQLFPSYPDLPQSIVVRIERGEARDCYIASRKISVERKGGGGG